MRRLHAGLTGIGVVVLLASLGGPWWSVSLEGGALVPVAGFASSALASSLLAVAGAAFGLSLLSRGVWRRFVSLLQVLAIGGAAYAIAGLAARPESAALSEIASLTGIAGAGALDVVVRTEPLAMLWVGVLGMVATIGSGLIGVAMPDKPGTTNRYQRSLGDSDPKDSLAVWDRLSEGSDPTTR